jgi:hypothetical protein
MNWSDGSQVFHFGNRLLHGSFPYRDYVYQIGLLPIVTDALAQRLAGERFLSSLLVVFFLKGAAISCIYLIARGFTSTGAAVLLAIGGAFMNPLLYAGGAHYYVECLFFAATYLFVAGLGIPSALRCGLAGFSLAMIVAVRQGDGVLLLLACVGVLVIYAFRERDKYLWPLFAPALLGILAGLAVIAAMLAAHGALANAATQLFIEGPEKKNIRLWQSSVDAITGGATGLGELLKYNLTPAALTLGVFYVMWRGRTPMSKRRSLVFGFVVGLGFVGFLRQQVVVWREGAGFDAYAYANVLGYDVPRVLLTAVVPFSCFWPKRSEAALGIPHPVFSIVAAMTLALVWARQLSWSGRPLTDHGLLMCMTIVFAIMPATMSRQWKTTLCATFAALTVGAFALQALTHHSLTTYDGPYEANAFESDHPMLVHLKVTKEKVAALDFLRQHVTPGDSCFIYGSAPVLYTLLGCRNPTLIDSTYPDFFTPLDAAQAIEALMARPPKWIIDKPNDPVPFYIGSPVLNTSAASGPLSQPRVAKLRTAMQSLIEDYQFVGSVDDFVAGTKRDPQIRDPDFDWIARLRLYQRIVR